MSHVTNKDSDKDVTKPKTKVKTSGQDSEKEKGKKDKTKRSVTLTKQGSGFNVTVAAASNPVTASRNGSVSRDMSRTKTLQAANNPNEPNDAGTETGQSSQI